MVHGISPLEQLLLWWWCSVMKKALSARPPSRKPSGAGKLGGEQLAINMSIAHICILFNREESSCQASRKPSMPT
jgi:hypothetical protein